MKFKYFDQSQRSDFRATLRWPINAKRRRRNSADQLSIKRQYCSTINQYQIPHIWRKFSIKLKEKVNPIDSGNYSPLLIFCVKLWKRLSLPINCNFLSPFQNLCFWEIVKGTRSSNFHSIPNFSRFVKLLNSIGGFS